MALILSGSTDLSNGISIPNAYVNAGSMTYNKRRGAIDVMMLYYKDAASYTAGKDPIKRDSVSLPVTLTELETTFIYTLVYGKLMIMFPGSTSA